MDYKEIKNFADFRIPKNINFWWTFGGIAMAMMVVLGISGAYLAFFYEWTSAGAFASIQSLSEGNGFGRIMRFVHMNAASFFLAATYIHIFRGVYYGSYKAPRQKVWVSGMVIFALMMATAFMGYTLPWSQMSGWSATVITSVFSAIPIVGDKLVYIVRGGYEIGDATLARFFVLHMVLPFIIGFAVVRHIKLLHAVGSNNPLGVEPSGADDMEPIGKNHAKRDVLALGVVMGALALIVAFVPRVFAHADHFIPFDAMSTPAHIAPEWYFLPFYAILRAVSFDICVPFTDIVLIDAKLGGVMAMFGAVVLPALLPWLDWHKVRSARFRPAFRVACILALVAFVALGYVGAQAPEGVFVIIGQVAGAYYFAFFLLILPLLSKFERVANLPTKISAF